MTQPDHCDSRSNTRVDWLPGAPPPSPGQLADAAALTGDTAPPAAKRLAMVGSEVPAIDGPAGRGAADGTVVALRCDRRGSLAKAAARAMR